MGNAPAKEVVEAATNNKGSGDAPAKKPNCKACCACPETKKARDKCVLENGEENCSELIEAHKQCMRSQGFNV